MILTCVLLQIIQLLNKLGITVSPKSIYNKRRELAQLQQQSIKNTVVEGKKLTECLVAEKSVVAALNLEKGTLSSTIKCFPTKTLGTISQSNIPTSAAGNHNVLSLERKQAVGSGLPIFTMASQYTSTSTDVTSSKVYFRDKPVENASHMNSTASATDISFPIVNDTAYQQHVKSINLHHQSVNQLANIEKNEKLILERIRKSEQMRGKWDIIGDNLDFEKGHSSYSLDKQRDSIHWFLNIGVKRRILAPHLSEKNPRREIDNVNSSEFFPSKKDSDNLQSNFKHHIGQIIVKYLSFLCDFKNCVESPISHPHSEEVSKKSEIMILGLMDKNENKDMIDIMKELHEKFIPQVQGEVAEPITFGGDVLTNERGYAAQLNMMNETNSMGKLAGMNHRPEGLHRVMNLTLVTT